MKKLIATALISASLLACTKQGGQDAIQYLRFGAKVSCIVAKMAFTADASKIAEACGMGEDALTFIEQTVSANKAAVQREMTKAGVNRCVDGGAQ